jgi:hypothetical protein
MMNGLWKRFAACLPLLVPALPLAAADSPPDVRPAPAPPARETELFEARVRPLLARRCYSCHSGKTAQGGLRLDEPAALLRGGEGGPVVKPGSPEESRLVRAVRYTDPHLQMPPSGKLPDKEIEILADWVRRGAPVPASTGAGAGGKKPAMSLEEGRRFWSIRPLQRSEPPPVKGRAWVARRIDQYLLAKLEAAGLPPSPPADRRTLIRRLSFDLLGLPPTPEEVEAFASDSRPDASSRLVERLLASPHYGERWGRHWLDLVRYCDLPESWAQTEAQPWRYRDWVVKALNDDLPYDRFVLRQLAADELPGTPPEDLAALGFLGLSPSYWKELKLAPDLIKTVVAEEWEERINTVSGTLLGLTVACARCHDHKFDPISQKDYYALAGIFSSTRLATRALLPPADEAAVLAARRQVAELEAEAKRLQDGAAGDPAHAEEKRRQAEEARSRARQLREGTPHFDAPLVYGVETAGLAVLPDGPDHTRLDYRAGWGQDVPLQLRGNPSREAETVPRRFPAVLSPGEPARFTQGSGRRELGEAIFRDAAPLAARVIVNRVWKHHFGRGLVETPSNFGTQGDRPSHPELLDDLAARFIAAGWSLKWLHREIVLSSAYRQTCAASPKLLAVDPDNLLLGRMSRRRLEVEAWRDAILAASGQLDGQLGGPAQELSAPENRRRTLYGTVKRRELDDLLRLYDFPDPTAHSPARFHTVTPLQGLYVLNSPFIGRQAAALGARVRAEAPGEREGQIRRCYALLYGRPPTLRELEAARAFLEGAAQKASAEEAWNQYLEVLLARNELMFVD